MSAARSENCKSRLHIWHLQTKMDILQGCRLYLGCGLSAGSRVIFSAGPHTGSCDLVLNRKALLPYNCTSIAVKIVIGKSRKNPNIILWDCSGDQSLGRTLLRAREKKWGFGVCILYRACEPVRPAYSCIYTYHKTQPQQQSGGSICIGIRQPLFQNDRDRTER